MSFCTMKLWFLYSTVPTLESIIAMVVTTSPSFNSKCLLLALLFLVSCWLCSFHPLWVRSFPLWVRSFVFLSPGSSVLPSLPTLLSLLTLRRCCCELCITPCVTFSCTARSLTCCAWSAGLTSTTVLSLSAPREKECDLRAQLLWFASTSFLALANGLSMTSIVLRVYCFDLHAYVPPKLFEFCSNRCVWPCASWSVGTSRHRHARFWSTRQHVWWSLALVFGASSAYLTVRSLFPS